MEKATPKLLDDSYMKIEFACNNGPYSQLATDLFQ